MPPRRFPPPWSVDETDACFIVRDGKSPMSIARISRALKRLHRPDALPAETSARRVAAEAADILKNPAALSMCDGAWRGSLEPTSRRGGNGLDCYNTIRSHETDASVVSAAIKCQAEVGKHSAADVIAKAPNCCGRCLMSATSRRIRRRNCRREGH
jgi:hypothetical protein